MKKYLLILLIPFLAFTFTGNPPGGWYQQFLPDIVGKQINDILFLDSLTGFAIASKNVNPDTSSILKTTNGGDNWQIILTQSSRRFSRVQFLNSLTGFISGGSGSGTPYLYKTTNGGDNWFTIPGATFGTAYWDDMNLLNEDTIWLVDDNGLNGGVFRTTNGGVNWTQQAPPAESIYFYNYNLGFYGTPSRIYRTTNGGSNWTQVYSTGFTDIVFADSLIGWCTRDLPSYILKTTDGGITWLQKQLPPEGGFYNRSRITDFGLVNKDTIWGSGPRAGIPPSTIRGMLYLSTDGGETWGYQLPDTSINVFSYYHIDFINKNNGWAYSTSTGVHTITGGDTTVYLGVHQISNEIPQNFILYQNYPNPFNPKTRIEYNIKKTTEVKITVFDISGKTVMKLVDRVHSPGVYAVDFPGGGLHSGIFFYNLIVDERLIDTKKMILVK